MGVRFSSPTLMLNELMVPDGTNVIINDTQRKDIDVRCLFARLYRVSLAQWLILGAEELNVILAPKIATTDALLLFPGYGSQPIKYSLSLNGSDIGSKRSFVMGKPISCDITVPDILIQTIKKGGRRVAIIDDVVSTALTINTIRKTVEQKVVGISWFCFPWLMKKSADVNKSIKIDPCLVYYRNASPVSVNRLSRLLEDTPKGKGTRRVYAVKYFSNGERFICDLNEFGDRL